MLKKIMFSLFLCYFLLVLSSAFGVWTNGSVTLLDASDTVGTLVTKHDTLTWLATKSNISGGPGGGQQYSDTTSWDATKTYVISRLDCTQILSWGDTTLTNGVTTDYDLSLLDSMLEKRYTRSYAYIQKTPSLTTATTEGITAPSLTATVASNDLTTGPFVKHSSSASNSITPTGVISAAFTLLRRDWEVEYFTNVRTDAKIDSLVINVGLFSAAVDTNRAPNRYEMKFRFHSQVDGTTWRTVTNNNNGGTQDVKNTGVTISANKTYALRIVCSNTTPDVKFYINGVLVSTHTTQLPTSTQYLGYGNRVSPYNATTRAISWGKIFIAYNS